MASNFQLNVKAIVDSANIQEQIKGIKIDPIKIQVDLGNTGSSNSGMAKSFESASSSATTLSGKIAGVKSEFYKLAKQEEDYTKIRKETYQSFGKYVPSDEMKKLKQYLEETEKAAQKEADTFVRGVKAKQAEQEKMQKTWDTNVAKQEKAARAEENLITRNGQQITALTLRIEGLTEEQNKRIDASGRLAKIEAMGAGKAKEQAVALRGLSGEISAVTKGMNTFHATLEYMTERFVQIGLYVAIFRKLTGAIRDMIGVVSGLDKSLVELRKVTDLTDSQLEDFTKTAFDVGDTVARTGQEVIDATAVFSRAGYDLKDALDLGGSALLLTNTADGINDVAEASSTLISVLRAFNMDATESIHIVDALNEVSNNFAIDTNNLADILKRVSGTLGQTGTTMEEVFGLAVGGFTTLRNAEVVAAGLNMISQRMRGMKEDGEAIEGLIPKIESALQKYTNGAVTMLDKQTGELRSTYDVLSDLAKIYPSLTSSQRAYLNEVIAGNNITLCVQKCA